MEHLRPERRRRVRILTLKNLGIAAIAIVVLLIGANLLSEARKTHRGEYGALFNHELGKTETIAPRKIEIVTEAPVPDHTAADPLLIEPAVRQAQYLDVKPAPATVPAPLPAKSSIAISGDAGAISVVAPPRRLLKGGFGR
jgi:hypothetical protein